MREPLPASVRHAIMFWILVPLFITLALLIFVEVSGRFFVNSLSDSAAGIMFLAAFVPIAAAHLSLVSAIAGLVLLLFGLRADKKLILSILLGISFGIVMLHNIYLG
ncbi:MAG TPA: hypothetical protein VEC35_11830 [Noviherbaspirillum sp.]|nr:hypothetical protein [Noviherbaspirillum sp.]